MNQNLAIVWVMAYSVLQYWFQFYCFLAEWVFIMTLAIWVNLVEKYNVAILKEIYFVFKIGEFGISSTIQVLASRELRSMFLTSAINFAKIFCWMSNFFIAVNKRNNVPSVFLFNAERWNIKRAHLWTLFTHFKTNTKTIGIYIVWGCCLLWKNENIVKVMKWAMLTWDHRFLQMMHALYIPSLWFNVLFT